MAGDGVVWFTRDGYGYRCSAHESAGERLVAADYGCDACADRGYIGALLRQPSDPDCDCAERLCPTCDGEGEVAVGVYGSNEAQGDYCVDCDGDGRTV